MKKLKLNLNLKKIEWPKINKFRKDAPLALMSYIHILVILPLIFRNKSDFVHYHSRQGLFLLGIWVLFGFSLFIPYLPWIFLIVIFVDMLFGIIYVLLSKEKPMPIFGKMAEKLNI